MSGEHKLAFGADYDEGERSLALVPMIRGLVRHEVTDVTDSSMLHDLVFEMWFDTVENMERFGRSIRRRLPGE